MPATTMRQIRFYDFNVYSSASGGRSCDISIGTRRNAGSVESSEQWAWGSFRSYAFGEKGRVRVDVQVWTANIKMRKREESGETSAAS